MEIGVPQSLTSDNFAVTLNEDSGYQVQNITGMSGSAVRNPVTNRPHKGGGIVHTFQRGPKVFTIEGLLLADTPTERQVLADNLRAVTDDMLQRDGRYVFMPPGGTDDTDRRFLEVRLYDQEEIITASSPVSGPKGFNITLIAGVWRARSVRRYEIELPADQTNVFVPNLGNTEEWPVIDVDGPTTEFDLYNIDTGFALTWLADPLGKPWEQGTWGFAQVMMDPETIYAAGDQHNLLSGVDLPSSDFWSIASGGAWVSCYNQDGTGATLYSYDTWV